MAAQRGPEGLRDDQPLCAEERLFGVRGVIDAQMYRRAVGGSGRRIRERGAGDQAEPASTLAEGQPLASAGNLAVQRAANGARLPTAVLTGTGAGNQALQRMLAIQRHPGKEKLENEHDASAHASEADRREHVRLDFSARRKQEQTVQEGFDTMTSETLAPRLTELATPQGSTLAIQIDRLPGKLQALVRQIQGTLTDVEAALAGEQPAPKEREARDEALRARIRTGARSWHDDLGTTKVPAPKNDAASSPRATFFADWHRREHEARKDVGNKQQANREKAGVTGGKYPLREYTAVGWEDGSQRGRLIYEPFDDVLYLSLFHYDEKETYFKIIAPRATGGAPNAPAARGPVYLSEWDLDLVLYQAYAELAGDLEAIASFQAKGDEGKDAKKRRAQLNAMSPEAQRYLGVLYELRDRYAAAYAEAKRLVEEHKTKQAQERRLALLDAKRRTGGKGKGKGSKVATAPEETTDDKFQANAPFTVWGQVFWVNSVAGYICFYRGKTFVEPGYTRVPISQVAALFRTCVETESPGSDLNATALMLAALVAEPARHSVAALEALLWVLERSPLDGDPAAYGDALPMATGGTIATGGVAVQVMLSEARIGREVILKLLDEHLKVGKEQVNAFLFDLAATEPDKLLKTVKEWLFAALMSPERRQKGFDPLAEKFAPPASDDEAADEKTKAAEQPVPATMAPAQTIEHAAPATPADPTMPEHLRVMTLGMPGRVRAASPWAAMASNIVRQSRPGEPLTPHDVLAAMARTDEYDEYATFWVAYETFRVLDHPGLTYGLSPIQVINYIRKRPPNGVFIMSDDDWRVYERFKREHPEFVYL